MSVTDWMANSRKRMAQKPVHVGVAESLSELWYGGCQILKWRLLQRLHGENGFASRTELAGASVLFDVQTWEDLRRADNGLREEPAMEWLLESVDEETVMWDIGGFHGTYSVVAAKIGAETHAFEPHPDNRTRLVRNARLNDLEINLHAYAMSDQETIARFTDPGRAAEFRADPNGPTKVKTKRGDDLQTQPDVVKLDVEGHECAVLDGMTETLQKVDRILVEVHEGVDEGDVQNRLVKAGLTVSEVHAPRTQTYLGGVRN